MRDAARTLRLVSADATRTEHSIERSGLCLQTLRLVIRPPTPTGFPF
jgi:hypothetical protein